MHPAIYLIAFSSVSAISLNSYWNESDTRRLSGILEVACEAVKKAELTDLDTLYHAVALLSVLPDCVLDSEIVENVILGKASSGESLYRALSIADHLKIKVDHAAFDKALTSSMKIDDDPTNLAWIMNAAAFLEKDVGAKYFDKIVNLVVQADEVDGKYLNFDSSIVTTAIAVRAIVALAEKQGRKPAVSEKKLLQMANYLLSRKHATAPKITYHLLGALKTLTDNLEFVPVVVSLEGPVEVASDQPIKIAVTNVFGEPVDVDGVRAEAFAVLNQTLISILELEPMPSDSRFWTINPDRIPIINDFVRLDIKIESKDKRLIGTTSSHVLIKRSRSIMVDDFKIGVAELGEEIPENSLKRVIAFHKIKDVLNVDSAKHLHLSFSMKYENDSYLKPHQCFVMFKHGNGHEVFYTANLVKKGRYAVDI
ncbi:unnamed protein product, partial [Cylicostephanus goldi]